VNSSVFSAWGMLLTDLRRDYLQTFPLPFCVDSQKVIDEQFLSLCMQAKADYDIDGVDADKDEVLFEYFADMRYAGQEHTVKTPLNVTKQSINIEAAIESFHAIYEKRFTYRLDSDVEIVNFHLVAKVEVPKPELIKKVVTGAALDDCVVERRKVDFDQHGTHDAVIYDGLQLEAGMELDGPAIIQESSVTLVVSPGHHVSIDDFGNYHIEINLEEK
jgi:N-methylhydantoinase A